MDTIIFDFYNTLYNPKKKRLFWGVIPLLKKLKTKSRLIIISTGNNERWKLISKLGLLRLTNQVIQCKNKTLEVFSGLVYSKTLVIGDRKESEINIGERLGLNTLLVKPQKENPVVSIKKYLKI